jgi:hypothetical protein
MNNKIAVMATLYDAFAFLLSNPKAFFQTWLVYLAGQFFAGTLLLHRQIQAAPSLPNPDKTAPSGSLLIYIAVTLLYAMSAVAWYRAVLLGESGNANLLGARLSRRELKYFALIWGFLFCLGAAAVVLLLIDRSLRHGSGHGMRAILAFSWLGFLFVAAYVIGRLAPVFAALSVGFPFSFGQAWRATAGNGARFMGLYLLLGIGGAILVFLIPVFGRLSGLSVAAPYSMILLTIAASTAVSALAATVNATAFRRLAPWQAPTSLTASP